MDDIVSQSDESLMGKLVKSVVGKSATNHSVIRGISISVFDFQQLDLALVKWEQILIMHTRHLYVRATTLSLTGVVM
jgi:hypothetical protein